MVLIHRGTFGVRARCSSCSSPHLHWYKRELFNCTDSVGGLMGQTMSVSKDNLEERIQILLDEVGLWYFNFRMNCNHTSIHPE